MHVPFCDVRCPYCHFACFVNRDATLFGRWAEAVATQFARMREHFGVESLASVYFGGGTPTALDPAGRDRITRWLAEELRPLLASGAEVTLECNPESTWPESIDPWLESGVNRLSLGLQSMDREELRFLGRLNTPESNRRVLDLAVSRVDNLSVDLIVASPGRGAGSVDGSLDEILQWPIQHVSAYLLEIHAATRFGRDLKAGRLTPRPDAEQAAIYRGLVNRLEAEGFSAYELSNFARPGFAARHNGRYWTREPYLGVGPSAHSFVDDWRWAELRDTAAWVTAVQAREAVLEDRERLGPDEIRQERVMLGLRLRHGIEESWVAPRAAVAREMIEAGLLRRSEGRLWATVDGWLLLDQIVARLVG